MKFIHRILNPKRSESIIITGLAIVCYFSLIICSNPDNFHLFMDGIMVFFLSLHLINLVFQKKPKEQSNKPVLITKAQKITEVILFCVILLLLLQCAKYLWVAFRK